MAFQRPVFSAFLVALVAIWAGGGCCCLDYCCDDGGCGPQRGQRQHGVGGAMWGNANCGQCGTDAPGCVAGGCGYPVGARRPHCRAAAAAGWVPDYPAMDAGWVPCRGPVIAFFAGVRDLFASASCGCGGYYIDEWYNDPPACHDPCMETCGTQGGISYDHSRTAGPYTGQPMSIQGGSDCGCNGSTTQHRPSQRTYATTHRNQAAPTTAHPRQDGYARPAPPTVANHPRRSVPRSQQELQNRDIEPVAYDQP
jgi:hypothetical protein